MLCDICQRPASCRCGTCNLYCCDDHGGERCFRCAGELTRVELTVDPEREMGVWTADRYSRPSGKGYLQCYSKPAMPTIYIDDDGPPECYECGALARQICSSCQNLFCPEHAGTKSICASCARSSLLGIIVFGIMVVFLGAVLALGSFLAR